MIPLSLLNNGQSCIAAKRFVVIESVADQFEALLTEKFQALKVGDPMKEDTDIGPLANASMLLELNQQVQETVTKGAKILIGGQVVSDRPGNFFQPTILTDIPKDSPGYHEEFFGPVALLFRVKDIDEAIHLANDTIFGLGASGWTNNQAEQGSRTISSDRRTRSWMCLHQRNGEIRSPSTLWRY